MKNKFIAFILASAFLAAFTGCSDSENSNTDTAPESVSSNTDESDAFRDAEVYGDFTATVRHIIPDYMYDSETPRAAVVTLFQSGPSVLNVGEETASKLKEGETYTFTVREQEMFLNPYQISDDGMIDYDLISELSVKDFREPTEDELGLNCWRVYYKEYKK